MELKKGKFELKHMFKFKSSLKFKLNMLIFCGCELNRPWVSVVVPGDAGKPLLAPAAHAVHVVVLGLEPAVVDREVVVAGLLLQLQVLAAPGRRARGESRRRRDHLVEPVLPVEVLEAEAPAAAVVLGPHLRLPPDPLPRALCGISFNSGEEGEGFK